MDPFYGPPQKIAEKENKQKYKQKWQKDLNYHLNGLNARVGENELRIGLFCCAIEQFLTPVLAGWYF